MKQYEKQSDKNQRLINKVQNLIFYLTLLFLPTQFGKHFWPNFAILNGIRVDYLSPTVYATDILIIFIFILSVAKLQITNYKLQINFKFIKSKILVIIFTTCLFIGIIFSKSPGAGFYGLLKLLEFSFFGYFTATQINFKKEWRRIALIFSLGLFFESFLAIAQYLKQGSIGGLFYFFGERSFNNSTPGIANASLNGALVLRPYGTFSHPNVLAGYLVIAMAIVIYNFSREAGSSFAGQFSMTKFKNIFFGFVILIGTAALFLTMSRVAILLWILILILEASRIFLVVRNKDKSKFSIFPTSLSHFVKTSRDKKLRGASNFQFSIFSFAVLVIACIICGVFVVSPIRYRFIGFNFNGESLIIREELVRVSFKMFLSRPVFGIGLNNFFINLPQYNIGVIGFLFQPVHNIFMLVLTETGIIGFLVFVWFMIKTYGRIISQGSKVKGQKFSIFNFQFLILSAVLILGMFDHYFLTLQQGQLMFSFVLGLCWFKSSK